MKTKLTIALVAALGALALAANAQDNNPPKDAPPGNGQGECGPGMKAGMGQRLPLPAVVRALDANHDGIVDSNEIANASAALKTLDKNGDGQLTVRELMGPPPKRHDGMMGGQHHGPDGFQGNGQRPPAGPPPGDDEGNNPPPGGPSDDQ